MTKKHLAAVLGTKLNLKLLSVCYLVCLYCVHMFIVMVKYYQESIESLEIGTLVQMQPEYISSI